LTDIIAVNAEVQTPDIAEPEAIRTPMVDHRLSLPRRRHCWLFHSTRAGSFAGAIGSVNWAGT